MFTYNSNSTTLEEAMRTTENDEPEITVQNITHKINKINSIELSQATLPNVYLYYNYSKPGNPRFQEASSSVGGTFNRFVTGTVQKNYGVAAEYNVFAIPQLFIKMKAAHNAVKASLFSTQSKKSEFYYNMALAYIGLCRAQNLVALQAKVFETSQSRYNEVEKSFSYGRATKRDLLSAESEFLTSQAKLEKTNNDLITAQQKYIDKFTKLHTNLTVPEVSLSSVAKNITELKAAVESNNQDLKSLEHAAKSYKAESYISAINALPTVTVGYREAYIIVDPILSIPDYRQGTFYIQAKMDLLNMSKYLSTFKNNNEKNKKIAEAKVIKKNHSTEAELLWNNTLTQEKMIDVLQKVVANSKEVYQITKKEVGYGSKSFTDELEAKEYYTKSEIDLLEAKLQKASNIYRLKYLTGKL